MSHPQHRPRKRFGQHFLKDSRVLHRIAKLLVPREGQNLVEIGPGLGALTSVLLEQVSHLTVIELDRDLTPLLRNRYSEEQLTILQQDILQCDLSQIHRRNSEVGLRLIGNLPYNISTPLIFHLLEQAELIEDMLFMLQREVAMRLAAKPGTKQYGRLTVMTAIDLDCECLFDVPPEAFDPPPKVESTIIRIWPKANRRTDFDRGLLNTLVTSAFAQRRKTLRNALGKLVSAEQFQLATIEPSLRAESISPEDFIRLAQVCA